MVSFQSDNGFFFFFLSSQVKEIIEHLLQLGQNTNFIYLFSHSFIHLFIEI